jgi:secreted PhoX family phosphatase
MTCQYRCGNACDHPVPNTSDNPYFGSELSRRDLVRASAAGALVLGFGGAALVDGTPAAADAGPDADAAFAATGMSSGRPATGGGPLTFKPIPPNRLDTLIVPNGYDSAVVISWGDEVVPGAPRFDPQRQTPSSQSKQFGYNNDFVAVIPLDRNGERALLVANHEYTNEELMFPGWVSHDALTVDQLRVAIAAHGMSVVEVERVGDTGRWRPVSHGRRPYNRRITALSTAFAVSGPAAGSPLLRTSADRSGRKIIGTLNNCAGGVTPWGTVLSGEENFNQYFVGGDSVPADQKPALARYGIPTDVRYPSGSRKWDRADARFDLAANPNEVNRFGWIIEVDPFDPDSTPVKHTALGRFKHEAATVVIAPDKRAVCYMGDDERFDYMYKFVSDKKFMPGDSHQARRHNKTLLESGTLYVAKLAFTSAGEIDGSGKVPADGAFNGTGEWLPLVKDGRSMVPGMAVDQVLVHTRLAADKLGPTKMDRPEDMEANPRTGHVYVALTNNTNRGAGTNPAADEANPRSVNRHGHIMEIIEDGGNAAGTTFTWSVPIVCGDPADPSTYFAGFDKTKVSPISCPDNVMFDGAGNLWIATDGNALNSNDGLFVTALAGPERGHLKQFLTVPFGAETCGPAMSADGRTVFVAVQHPGEISGFTMENPASTWPDGDFAKPSVACSWRLDGRYVGA